MWSVGRKAAWLWRNCLDGTLRPARNPEQARHSQCRGTLQGSHVARPGRGAGMRSRNTSPSAASLPPTPATSDSGANGPSVPCLAALNSARPSGQEGSLPHLVDEASGINLLSVL